VKVMISQEFGNRVSL